MQLAPSPEERLFDEPPPKPKAVARRYALVVLLCFLAHATGIVLLGRYGGGFDGPPPVTEEIPVEVIVEQPPPPKQPDPPQAQKEQPKKQAVFDEKEATDAPKASEQKADRDVRVDAPQSDKAKPAPQQAKPEKSAEKSTVGKAAEEKAQQQKDDRPDGEPLKAAEKPSPEPEQTKAAEAAPEPVKQQTSEDILAAALRYAPAGGGNAEATYLSTVYGQVAAHLNLRKITGGRRFKPGEVGFYIDYGGAFAGGKVTKSSGLPDLDAAVLAAIRAAGPFPLPPTGTGLTLIFRFNDE
jgi:protein TonB